MIQPSPSHPLGVWDLAYLDSQPIPHISKDLLPWLIRDRREAEVGSGNTCYNPETKEYEPDKQNLNYAERELRRIKTDLANAAPGSNRAAILALQVSGQEKTVQFYRGKCHLLDRVIAATKALP